MEISKKESELNCVALVEHTFDLPYCELSFVEMFYWSWGKLDEQG